MMICTHTLTFDFNLVMSSVMMRNAPSYLCPPTLFYPSLPPTLSPFSAINHTILSLPICVPLPLSHPACLLPPTRWLLPYLSLISPFYLMTSFPSFGNAHP